VPIRLARYVLLRYLRTCAVIEVAVVCIYLAIDFTDRAHLYKGPHVLPYVSLLYACKALGVGYQLLPASMLLAAGASLSALRRTGELTAMGALSVRPAWIYGAIFSGGVLCVALTFALQEVPVRARAPRSVYGWAGQQVDVISARRFSQWGDFGTWYDPRRWFRGRDHIYLLRRGVGAGFDDVSIFTLTPDFHLAARLDAARMEPVDGGAWRLRRGARRTFPRDGQSTFEPFQSRVVRFPEDPGAFRLRVGRPEQLTLPALRDEVARRERLGLDTTGYRLAEQSALAYPSLGLPAALLAAALALRRKRKGHLTAALLEGVGVVAVLWCGTVLCRAAASAGTLSPAAAAWIPVAVLALAAGAAIAVLD